MSINQAFNAGKNGAFLRSTNQARSARASILSAGDYHYKIYPSPWPTPGSNAGDIGMCAWGMEDPTTLGGWEWEEVDGVVTEDWTIIGRYSGSKISVGGTLVYDKTPAYWPTRELLGTLIQSGPKTLHRKAAWKFTINPGQEGKLDYIKAYLDQWLFSPTPQTMHYIVEVYEGADPSDASAKKVGQASKDIYYPATSQYVRDFIQFDF